MTNKNAGASAGGCSHYSQLQAMGEPARQEREQRVGRTGRAPVWLCPVGGVNSKDRQTLHGVRASGRRRDHGKGDSEMAPARWSPAGPKPKPRLPNYRVRWAVGLNYPIASPSLGALAPSSSDLLFSNQKKKKESKTCFPRQVF